MSMGSDGERLIQAAHILRASIVANDTTHPMEFDLSFPMEAADSLIRDVIEHRSGKKRSSRATRPPGRPPTSATAQLLQASSILTVCFVANDTEPNVYKKINFSDPLHAALVLIDEAREKMGAEDDATLLAAMRAGSFRPAFGCRHSPLATTIAG